MNGSDSRGATANGRLIKPEERLIVALDVPDKASALAVVDALGEGVVFYKIGLQLLFNGGLELAAHLIGRGKKVFVDCKLFDIDQTVRGATRNIAAMGVDFLTVHGDARTVRAAVDGRGESALGILAVTVLTSFDASDLAGLGVSLSVEDLVIERAKRAFDAGADGVIASGREARAIREVAGVDRLIVTPGIRSAGVPRHDQKRVTTPADAIGAGADYLVVGRQILDATDPAKMATAIIEEIRIALEDDDRSV